MGSAATVTLAIEGLQKQIVWVVVGQRCPVRVEPAASALTPGLRLAGEELHTAAEDTTVRSAVQPVSSAESINA